MRFPAMKPAAPVSADGRMPAETAKATVDVLSVTSSAASAMLRANGAQAVLRALLQAAAELGAPRPRAGLWRQEENSYAMWQLDASKCLVPCGSAPASLYAAVTALEHDHSMVGSLIPVAGAERRWGILDVSGQISDGTALAALAIIARQAAMVMESGSDIRALDPASGLLATIEKWWEIQDADELLVKAIGDIARLASADSCCVTLLGEQAGALQLLFSEDVRAATPGEHLPWRPPTDARRNKDAVLRVLRTGEPIAFRWNPTSEALKAGILPSGPEEGSYEARPLLAAGCVVGVLDIYARTARAFATGQEEILSVSSRMLGRILNQRRNDMLSVEACRNQDILAQMNTRLAAHTEVTEVAATLVDAARALWPKADLVYVMLPQAEGGLWSIAALDSARPEDQRHGWARSGEGFVGWVIQSRQSLAVNSAADDPRRGALDRGQNVKSGVWTPIQQDHNLMGIVAVCFTETGGGLVPADVEMLENVAEHGALALERVRDRHSTQAAFWDAIEAISGAIDARDGYTHGHSRNVTEYAVAIAQRLDMPIAELQNLRAAALMHDIGKIGIPDHILNKPGVLTPDERTVMESHPEVGYQILQRAPSLQAVLPVVRFHHERVDGAGYPQGLTGDALPQTDDG
jgi:putative nucleotidyltransferase with HDIG domain